MKTAKLIIDGKEIEVQLTEEQAQELTAQKKVTGFERVKADEIYFYTDGDGELSEDYEAKGVTDDIRYRNTNYYSDATLAEWCTKSDTLNRKMRRWAAEHNTEPNDWSVDCEKKYYLYYFCGNKNVLIESNYRYMHPSAVYFNTKKIAQAAIEEFGDEIKWLAENRPKWL